MGTKFSAVYNRFLGKITDDMYVELTPEDTLKDLQHLLLDGLQDFEYPRINLFDYTIETAVIEETDLKKEDFVIGIIWADLPENPEPTPQVLIDNSYFNVNLTQEEQNILALIMLQAWIQRQTTSIENTRMKYSGSDFKMTSQANHLQKLINLQSDTERKIHKAQRLYKRREINSEGKYQSTWHWFGSNR